MASLNWGSATHAGRIRAQNEDNLVAVDGVYVVADGMGGHEAGEIAQLQGGASPPVGEDRGPTGWVSWAALRIMPGGSMSQVLLQALVCLENIR